MKCRRCKRNRPLKAFPWVRPGKRGRDLCIKCAAIPPDSSGPFLTIDMSIPFGPKPAGTPELKKLPKYLRDLYPPAGPSGSGS